MTGQEKNDLSIHVSA